MSDPRLAWIERGRLGRFLLLVSLLAILPYLNSLQGDFTFDDPAIIRDNPSVTGNAASAIRLFMTPYRLAAMYRPLTMLTYLANAQLGGSVVGYHVVNVGLHALVAVAVFCLAWQLLGSMLGATVTAVLFALHPIHTEAVSSLVGRAELLAALFVLVSLLTFIRALDGPQPRRLWLLISAVALVLGCLAKESAFVGIPLCAIVYLWRTGGVPPIRSWAVLAPCTLAGIACLVWRTWIVGALGADTPKLLDNPLAYVPVLPRLGTALVVLWQYLSAMALPLRLSADYSYNQIPVVGSAFDPRFIGAAVLFTCLAAALVLSVRRLPELLLAAAFMIVPLSLSANIFFPSVTIKAERLLYLPSFGWCLALGALFMEVPTRRRRQAVAVVVALATAYAGRTWVRNWDWRDNLTLFTATVQSSPHSAKAHHNLAVHAYAQRKDVETAMVHFREALAIYPPYDVAAFGLGRMYEEKGMEDAALQWYARAAQLNPTLVNAHLNRGTIYYKRGEYTTAEAAFRAGLENEPANPRLLIALSLVRLAQGNRVEAQTIVDRVAAAADGDAETAELVAGATHMLQEAAPR